MKFMKVIISILLITSFMLLSAQTKTKPVAKPAKAKTQVKTSPKIIGKIGDKVYTYDDFNKTLESYYTFWEKKGVKLTPDKKEELNNQCWEELIARYIYDKEIKNKKINVSDQEINNFVLNQTPDDIRQIKDLQTDGKFDKTKLQMALEQNAQFKQSVYDFLRGNMVYDKLFDSVKSSVKPNVDSLKTVWLKNNNKASAQIIYFDYKKLKDMPVTDPEINEYYEKNKETFKKDPARKFKYIKFANITTSQDTVYTQALADSLYRAILSGQDFAEMAKKYSEDTGSGKNGGDLGFFGRGRMVPEFEKACFETTPGKIAAPIKTQFGWHIIKTVEKRTNAQGQEEVQASHILIKTKVLPEKAAAFNTLVQTAFNDLKTQNIEAVATKNNMKAEETEEFYEKSRFIPVIGAQGDMIKFAFTNHIGAIPEIYTGRDGSKYVCVLSDTIGVHYSPIEKEKTNIINKLNTEKKIAKVLELSKQFHSTVKPEEYMEQAKKDSLQIIEAKDILSEGFIPTVGKVDAVNKAIFNTDKGKFTDLITTDKAAYLALVTDKQNVADKEWQKAKKGEIEKFRFNTLNNWYFKKKQEIKIEDNRRKYYKLKEPQQNQIKLM